MYLFTHPTVTPTSAQTTAVNSLEIRRITFCVSEGASQKAFFKKKLKRKFQCLWHSFYNLQDKFMTLTEFLRQCKKKRRHWCRLPPTTQHQSLFGKQTNNPVTKYYFGQHAQWHKFVFFNHIFWAISFLICILGTTWSYVCIQCVYFCFPLT